jgi:polar amino acid transport system substrate-binding protein
MNKTQTSLVAFFCLFLIPFSATAGTPITICTDTNFWYPFTYVKDENKQIAGLHIDIINKALADLGYEPNYKPMAWKQCLNEVKNGRVDAIATVSYKADRANFLDYPEGASAGQAKSNERVTQVEYIVITPVTDANGKANVYSYNGDIKTIPSPVRIPAGYSIVENLEQAGLTVEENPHSLDNFKKLAKEKTGSVIDLKDVAQHFITQPDFSGKIVIASEPIFSKSYFLGFSKKGSMKAEDQKKIWQAIAKVREDEVQMGKFLEQY